MVLLTSFRIKRQPDTVLWVVVTLPCQEGESKGAGGRGDRGEAQHKLQDAETKVDNADRGQL